MGAPVGKESAMQPMLLEEFVARDRLVELVALSHEAALRAEGASARGPRASVGAALIRAGLKLNPAAGMLLTSRSA